MNQRNLDNTIFGENITTTEKKLNLFSISEEYPYFGLAHYFALKHTAKDDKTYETIAAKTGLFFNNHFYLQNILNKTEEEKISLEEKVLEDERTNLPLIEKEISPEIDLQNEEKIDENKIENNIENNIENFSAIKISEEMDTTETELKFEPLHTSDYFASQGIKLSNIVLPNDRLGMQLKSFTSWLRTMKKTHPDKLPTNNILAEVAVQKMAENSNIEADIYTEPMAEAYVQQGKNVKAIEIYSKLSLMFPEKSSYFATLIENLK